jgi:flagellar biosynthesis/type III secretory pathway protein FliH
VIQRGRVVKGAVGAAMTSGGLSSAPLSSGGASRGRSVPAVIVDAHAVAAELRRAAEKDAAEVRAAAHAEVDALRQSAAEVARAEETARFAAQYLALKAEADGAAVTSLDRAVQLAVVLAERLLGAALELEPSRVLHLAQQALAEARGAKVTAICAHPLDADALRMNLEALASGAAFVIHADDTLPRGSLSIDTTLGILDAKLAPQLERLARALRPHLAG